MKAQVLSINIGFHFISAWTAKTHFLLHLDINIFNISMLYEVEIRGKTFLNHKNMLFFSFCSLISKLGWMKCTQAPREMWRVWKNYHQRDHIEKSQSLHRENFRNKMKITFHFPFFLVYFLMFFSLCIFNETKIGGREVEITFSCFSNDVHRRAQKLHDEGQNQKSVNREISRRFLGVHFLGSTFKESKINWKSEWW